jgi:hypothetical protein
MTGQHGAVPQNSQLIRVITQQQLTVTTRGATTPRWYTFTCWPCSAVTRLMMRSLGLTGLVEMIMSPAGITEGGTLGICSTGLPWYPSRELVKPADADQ